MIKYWFVINQLSQPELAKWASKHTIAEAIQRRKKIFENLTKQLIGDLNQYMIIDRVGLYDGEDRQNYHTIYIAFERKEMFTKTGKRRSLKTVLRKLNLPRIESLPDFVNITNLEKQKS